MILRFLRRIFHLSVTVQTTKRRQTDYDRLKAARCRQLASEIGYPWPPAGKAGA